MDFLCLELDPNSIFLIALFQYIRNDAVEKRGSFPEQLCPSQGLLINLRTIHYIKLTHVASHTQDINSIAKKTVKLAKSGYLCKYVYIIQSRELTEISKSISESISYFYYKCYGFKR